MSFFPASLENLVDKFASLPGIGRKSAQRLAFHVLSLPDDEAQSFADAIVSAKKSVHCCKVCQNLTEGEICQICASDTRDKSTVCVVSEPRDVLSIERGREYNGTYHGPARRSFPDEPCRPRRYKDQGASGQSGGERHSGGNHGDEPGY